MKKYIRNIRKRKIVRKNWKNGKKEKFIIEN